MSDGKRRFTASRIALVTALFGACAGQSGQYPIDPEHGISAVQFDDIPVPDGFRMRTNRHQSHSRQVGSFRYGDFEYYGRLPPTQVVAYLKERMAVHGYELRDAVESAGVADLTFWRQPYETNCQVWRDASTTRIKVAVRTKVVPMKAAD